MRHKRFLILVRHGSREVRWDLAERGHHLKMSGGSEPEPVSDFEKEGRPAAFALAGRLADQLEADGIRVDQIVHSPHKVAVETAKAYETVLRKRGRLTESACRRSCQLLDPERWTAKRVAMDITAWCKQQPRGPEAFVLIGHQPQLTELAKRFAKLPTGVLPLGAAEAACIRLGWWFGRLLWLLTSQKKDVKAELRQKIASKYDVAKFFLGALVINGGLLVNAKLWELSAISDKVIVALGYLCLLTALVLSVATLFAYDSLLMPRQFWGAGGGSAKSWSVLRPPSEDTLVLYYEMVHVWTRLFLPAAIFAVSAVLLFLVALAHQSLRESFVTELRGYVVLAGAALFAVGLPCLYYRRRRPRLGSED